MNFDEAIQAHSAWKDKLATYLKNPDGSINAPDVQSDCKCVLGKWIYDEGKKWNSRREYATLKDEHAKFHIAAASVVYRANAGVKANEEAALGGSSEFARASVAVVAAIRDLKG